MPGVGAPRTAGRSYSRLVSLLRIGLPMLALGLTALIAVWPTLREIQRPSGRGVQQESAMTNARYYARDRQDRPFSMTAKTAVEVPGQRNLVDLTGPEAEITQTDGSWVTLSSQRGRYNQDTGRLLLLDSVHVLRDDGFEFTTDEAELDTHTGNSWGNHKVAGQGPSGEIRAQGFVATDHGKTITFTQSSTATVSGGSGKGKPK